MRITPRKWPSTVFNRRRVFSFSIGTSNLKDATGRIFLTPPQGGGARCKYKRSQSNGQYDRCHKNWEIIILLFIFKKRNPLYSGFDFLRVKLLKKILRPEKEILLI